MARQNQLVILPTSPLGWIAAIVSAIGLGSWLVLPLITTLFADEYPAVDSYAMPVIGLGLTALAAVVNSVAVWRGQRSVLSLLCLLLTVTATLFFGLFVIGEGLSGA